MKRHLLGIAALGLTLSGLLGLFLGYSTQSQAGMAAGVGLRAGLILTALWVAFPQLLQLVRPVPAWLLGTVAIGTLIVVVRPQTLGLVAVAVAALVGLQFLSRVLNPPKRRSARRRRDPSHAAAPHAADQGKRGP